MYRVSLLVLVIVGTVFGVSAYELFGSNTALARQDAQQQFLTEGNNGAPVAITRGLPGVGLPRPALVGTVEQITGDKITVKQPIEGTNAIVHVTAATKVRKTVNISLSDIKPGDTVMALGKRNGTTFQAGIVQIGLGISASTTSNLPAGLPNNLPAGVPTPPAGLPNNLPAGVPTPPAGLPNNLPAINGGAVSIALDLPVMGMVDKVEGNIITVKSAAGTSIRVELGAKGIVLKRTEVQVTEIQPGSLIAVQGEQKGDSFEASQVEILPKLSNR